MFVWRVDVLRDGVRGVTRREIAGADGRDRAEHRAARATAATGACPPERSIERSWRRAERVRSCAATFGWSDVGSWAAMAALWGTDAAGNARADRRCSSTAATRSSTRQERLVAVVGAEDLIVVDSPDALLVCSKSRAQDVRRVVEALAHGRYRHLL